jgi:MarR family transcriptional regulator, multiple antibiotic resistance protein MarR
MPAYDPATYEPTNAVPGLIGRVRAAFLANIEERLAPLDLKAADYLVLVTLANGNVDTASSVCSVLAHDPGAMTRKIDALEARGLVRRVRSEEDRRAIKLELTPEGKKLYPKALAAAIGVANDFLEDFSKAEVKVLEGFLRRILANAETQATVKG